MSQADTNTVLTVPEPGKVEMKKRRYPHVKPGSVLVKTEIAAVCVDDRMYTDHVHEWFDHPLYGCGHEGVGTVVEAPGSDDHFRFRGLTGGCRSAWDPGRCRYGKTGLFVPQEPCFRFIKTICSTQGSKPHSL